MPESSLGDAAYLPDLLRRQDRDRYLATLTAPARLRPPLWALLAFNFEIARVPEIASTPLIGQIRLQWWRDVLLEIAEGRAPRAHPVAAALAGALAGTGVDPALLHHMIDAREAQDLGQDPPSDMAALEAYAEATSACLLQAELQVLGADTEPAATAARHLGIAWSLTGLLRAAPHHRAQGRCYIPQDLAGPVARTAVAHLAAARNYRGRVTRRALPVLVLARPCAAYLRLIAAGDGEKIGALHDWPLSAASMFWGRLIRRF